MAIQQRNGRWHFRFMMAGQTYTGNTQLTATEDNRAQAELFEDMHQDLVLRGENVEPIEFEVAVDRFLGWASGEYSEATAKRFSSTFVALRRHFTGRLLQFLTATKIEQFKKWREEEHAPNTLRNDLNALKVFFGFAVKMRWKTSPNPLARLVWPKQSPGGPVRTLSPQEEDPYLKRCLDQSPDLHDVARLMLLQGARAGELVSLKKADVDLDRKEAEIRHLRGRRRKHRRLYLTLESCAILAARMDRPGPWVFPSPTNPSTHIVAPLREHRAVLKAMRYGHGEAFGLADLRKTFAVRCLERGMEVFTLAAIMGTTVDTLCKQFTNNPTKPLADSMKRAMEPKS
jgi:integrase